MSASLIQVIDTTIANVALPHMQAALGAAPDTIGWVLTSYIIMQAVATPITGWLEGRFDRRTLFAVSVGGFTVSSALCGMATSLEMMVASRALQGVFGAFIAPLGQATILDITEPTKHPQAIMMWGMATLIGPIIGPILGGWLTDNYGWRWVFFINIPIGLAGSIAIPLIMDRVRRQATRFDLTGFGLLGAALVSVQLLLDRGSQLDWFQSREIVVEAAVAGCCFWMFLVHSATTPNPLVPLALFRDSNYLVSLILITLLTGVVVGGAALMAPFLQTGLGYTAMGAGVLTVPRGIGAMITMPIANFLNGRVQTRVTVAGGLLMIISALWIMTGFNLEMGSNLYVISAFLQGVGTGLAFLPLNVLAFATLAPRLRTEAAALYNLCRNFGSSVAISILTSTLARNLQVSHADLVAAASSKIGQSAGLIFDESGASTATLTNAMITRQALMISYLDDFDLMMWTAVAALPLVLLMGSGRRRGSTPVMMAE